jgi:hypothetical protein
MANPFPFVAGEVLTAADMNGIGETVSFTPTWTNLTVGNGTLNHAFFTQVQKLVFVQVQFTLGSTSAVTGNISIAAPVPQASPTQNIVGTSVFGDASGVPYTGVVSMTGSAMQIVPVNASSTYTYFVAASSTIPMTWTTGDVIVMCATYRAA